ncbi:hypothetical protein GJAV_G00168470 [Gymnothorax javanicus]|nr:hypothetical protein GJAV_G00168470 [Gymnothorax javanicus]
MVKEIGDLTEFEAALSDAGDKLVVVDFTASWCGPCKLIGPVFHKMAEEPDFSDVVFISVDVDDAQEVTEKYGITCMPTFLFFKHGEKIDSFSGAAEKTLREKVTQHK